MRKGIAAASMLALASALAVTGCATAAPNGSGAPAASTQNQKPAAAKVEVKKSPDKYTWYVKDYSGLNAASIGYSALDGFRRDRYGAGIVKIIYVAADGSFVDPEDDEILKDYVVVGQNIKPNTEIKLEFDKDSEGEEYDNLTTFVSIEEIVLAVNKVGNMQGHDAAMTEISASPDKYTHHVRDYVGRNLAECGYYALGGFYADRYGDGFLKLNIAADDGSFVDPEDDKALSQYVVTEQDVSPNTEISMTYSKDPDGKEYGNLIDSQTVEGLTLYVSEIEK